MRKLKLILTGLFFLILSIGVMAQGGPPQPPDGHGSGTDEGPGGGGAPLGSGLFILVAGILGYSGKKIYDMKKKSALEDPNE